MVTGYKLKKIHKEIIEYVREHPGCIRDDLVANIGRYSLPTLVSALVQLEEDRIISTDGTAVGRWGRMQDRLVLSPEFKGAVA